MVKAKNSEVWAIESVLGDKMCGNVSKKKLCQKKCKNQIIKVIVIQNNKGLNLIDLNYNKNMIQH